MLGGIIMNEYFEIQRFQEYMEEKEELFRKLGKVEDSIAVIKKRNFKYFRDGFSLTAFVLFIFVILGLLSAGCLELFNLKGAEVYKTTAKPLYDALVFLNKYTYPVEGFWKTGVISFFSFYFAVCVPFRYLTKKDANKMNKLMFDKNSLNSLLRQYYEKYDNPPIAFEYCCPAVIEEILNIMDNKNLSSKEAIAIRKIQSA